MASRDQPFAGLVIPTRASGRARGKLLQAAGEVAEWLKAAVC
jgi:hypothetical protein